MSAQKLKFQIASLCPVILHNGQTADPLNHFSKALKQISSKRGKTDADFEEMARIEWYSSLYTNKGRICIPSMVMEAALVNGSKKRKLGKTALAGLFIEGDLILEFDGDNLTVDELWERDQNRLTSAVKIQTSKVMRTRSYFPEWQGTFEVHFDDEALNPSQIKEIVEITGSQIGLCDWRPKFGRYRLI